MIQPTIHWDSGSAYDFFMSLKVLHEPDTWGLRGAWAAGVRSRLAAEQRDFLKEIQGVLFVPLHFIRTLPAPRSSAAALHALAQMPAAQRIEALLFPPYFWERQPESAAALRRIRANGRWDAADVTLIYGQERKYGIKKKDIEALLEWWVQPAAFGERVLEALTAYRDVFFAEEEQRIEPYLTQALQRAQRLAADLTLTELIEEITSGVRYERDKLAEYHDVTFAPSYWATPLLIWGESAAGDAIYLFGARPDDASLVPGEVVPDALYQALKALADPTRLKILKYLSAEPHTPTELANKLRLRAPTVIHHLHTLRLAQLVYVTLYAEGKRYAARTEAITRTIGALQHFLRSDGFEPETLLPADDDETLERPVELLAG